MSASRLAASSEEQRLRASFGRLQHTAQELLQSADDVERAAQRSYADAERSCAQHQHRAAQLALAQAAQARDEISEVLINRAQRLAPGLAGAAWSDPRWLSGEWLGSGGSSYLRLGSCTVPGLPADLSDHKDLPALVPLLDLSSLTLWESAEQHWTSPVLHSLILRALAGTSAVGVEISVFDPKLTGVMSPLGRLRTGAQGGQASGYGGQMLGEPLTSSDELLEWLREARGAALRVAELAGLHGAANLGQLREHIGDGCEPYRLLILLGYPYGLDAPTHAELLRLVHAGPARGVSFVLVTDPAALASSELDCVQVLQKTIGLRAGRGGLSVDGLTDAPSVVVLPDPPPSRELVERLTDQLLRAAVARSAPVVRLSELLPAPEHRWSGDATDGVSTPIGMAGTAIAALQLRSADPALPNLLVGGASGQGKSNLLLVLLHGIAARYSPEQVQMYLLDFKDGLEFDRLGPSPERPYWLPHVQVLGLEGDRSFGLAVLRHLDTEFSRRAKQFRACGASSLSALRRKRPDEIIPRLLLVIDEFQVLVAEGDEIGREAVSIIETLARRGRAVGIHLVLASQTLSGIDTLASKERSIFGQFPWRVSLKTEASESEAVLGRGNTEAAQLRYRGEAILNCDYGASEHNQRAVVAYADETELDLLREQLWRASNATTPPRVFYARQPSAATVLADLLAQPSNWCESGIGEEARAILGLPIQVSSRPVTFDLRGDPGSALALLGEGRDDALGVLCSAALALAVTERYSDRLNSPAAQPAKFVLLDGAMGSGEHAWELSALARQLRRSGHEVELVPTAEIGERLLQLGEVLNARLGEADRPHPSLDDESELYVIGAGLHRAPRLAQLSMAGSSPMHVLAQLVREGPLARMHLLGWWNSARVFTEQLGYEASPLLAGLVFLQAPEADVQAMCGPYVRFAPQPHRALFVDRGSGGQPVEFVPFTNTAQSMDSRATGDIG